MRTAAGRHSLARGRGGPLGWLRARRRCPRRRRPRPGTRTRCGDRRMRAPSSCGRWSSRTRWSSAASVDERAVAFVVTGATGLEPATSGVTGRRSNQLNYAPGCAWPGAAMSMPQHAPRGSQPDSRPRTIAWGWRATAGTTRMAHYLPIEQHGIIGDLHTVALVGTDGTID